jgi:hypothetical protein
VKRQPMWVNVTVILTCLALLAYNIVVVGAEGLPNSYLLVGVLSAYSGVDQILKRRDEKGKDDGEGGSDA